MMQERHEDDDSAPIRLPDLERVTTGDEPGPIFTCRFDADGPTTLCSYTPSGGGAPRLVVLFTTPEVLFWLGVRSVVGSVCVCFMIYLFARPIAVCTFDIGA
jgi:hypothetical protein